jgi:hypothetical protein
LSTFSVCQNRLPEAQPKEVGFLIVYLKIVADKSRPKENLCQSSFLPFTENRKLKTETPFVIFITCAPPLGHGNNQAM